MNVVSENREIVGTLKTLLGTYNLLSVSSNNYVLPVYLRNSGAVMFRGLNDEGYETEIIVRGDFVVMPLEFPVVLPVKRVLSKEEEKDYNIDDLKRDLIEQEL